MPYRKVCFRSLWEWKIHNRKHLCILRNLSRNGTGKALFPKTIRRIKNVRNAKDRIVLCFFVLTRNTTMSRSLFLVEIRQTNFKIYVLCYEQTSPLAVSHTASGTPFGFSLSVPHLFSSPFYGYLKKSKSNNKGQ